MIYTIKYGDTLSALAKKYNTTVDALARTNNIKDPDKIYAGKTLIVPGIADLTDPWVFDWWGSIKRFFGL